MRIWYLVIGGAALYIAWILSSNNTAYGYIAAFTSAMVGGQFIQRAIFSSKKKYKKKYKRERRRYY